MSAAYQAARERAAFLALPERALLVASGPDRQKFLNSLLSNEIAKLAPGQGCLAALMDVKGHLAALMRVLVAADSVRLELPAERVASVEATLVHYKVAAPVRFSRPALCVLALLGPQASETLAQAGAELPGAAAESHVATRVAGHPALVARASDLPQGGLVLHVEAEAKPAVEAALSSAGAVFLDREAFDALRIEQGLPVYGTDVDESHLLHETGLVSRYHSPSKGCYLGQEVIARLEARGGNVSRALRGLLLSAPCAPGAVLSVDGQPAGRVTSVATSPRLGPIALGYVHRNHFAPGTRVEVEGQPAVVAALPFAEGGRPA